MVVVENNQGVAVLRMDRDPVNAMNFELLEALLQAHRDSLTNDAQAVVITGKDGLFSAGLDVPALLNEPRERILDFWRLFFDLLQAMAESPVPVIAAISGHAPAGGAVLALHCDYRVMQQGEFRIGMNEVQVGLPVPVPILRVLQHVVGKRQAALMAMTGAVYSPDEALSLGLIDAVAAPGEVVNQAMEYAQQLLALPPVAMNTTRLAAGAGAMGVSLNNDIEAATYWWFSDETQASMRKLVESLGK